MKRTLLAIILIADSKSASYLFEVGTGLSDVSSSCIAGANQEYVVQGKATVFRTFEIDWQSSPHSSLVKTVTLGANGNLDVFSTILCDDGYNCVVGTNTVFRINIKPGELNGFEEYAVAKGFLYSYPQRGVGTNYLFIASRDATNAADKKAYRLLSDTVTGLETFNIGINSRTYVILHGTGWVLLRRLESEKAV